MRRALLGLVVVGACYRAGELPDGHAAGPDAPGVTDAKRPPDAPTSTACLPTAGAFANHTMFATSTGTAAIASEGTPTAVLADDGQGNVKAIDLKTGNSGTVVASAGHPALDASGTSLYVFSPGHMAITQLTGSGNTWGVPTVQVGFPEQVVPNPPGEVNGTLRMVVVDGVGPLLEYELQPGTSNWTPLPNIAVPNGSIVTDPALSADGQLLVLFATTGQKSGIFYAVRDGSGLFQLDLDTTFELVSSDTLAGLTFRSPVLSSDCTTLYAVDDGNNVDRFAPADVPP